MPLALIVRRWLSRIFISVYASEDPQLRRSGVLGAGDGCWPGAGAVVPAAQLPRPPSASLFTPPLKYTSGT